MNDADDFRELWQSQTVANGQSTKVPRFGLLEDLTVPVFTPLSPWRRVSYALWAACIAQSFWRDGHGPGWLHQTAGWTALVVGIAGIVLALAQRDRTHDPQPEESLQSYRMALRSEFERQFQTGTTDSLSPVRGEHRGVLAIYRGSSAGTPAAGLQRTGRSGPCDWLPLLGRADVPPSG